MWLTGRLKLKGKTTFSAESSWCKNAIGVLALLWQSRNPLISLGKYRWLNPRILHPEKPCGGIRPDSSIRPDSA
ncbi:MULTISPECIES: hypothetical protein [Pseudomonas]|uniref:hypothetical protein n=1 Tax=Pseudomonas TaxID=286 RepID=UPI00130EF738|nr:MULTISPECIES: hypothetical protein [Pseudomonas]UOK38830.1 hypothetical protein MJP36_02960 [Pseudomonas palleroniana]